MINYSNLNTVLKSLKVSYIRKSVLRGYIQDLIKNKNDDKKIKIINKCVNYYIKRINDSNKPNFTIKINGEGTFIPDGEFSSFEELRQILKLEF